MPSHSTHTTMGDPQEDRADGTLDKAKGRAKEAAGALTGDRKKKAEGQKDQAKGEAKKQKADAEEFLKRHGK